MSFHCVVGGILGGCSAVGNLPSLDAAAASTWYFGAPSLSWWTRDRMEAFVERLPGSGADDDMGPCAPVVDRPRPPCRGFPSPPSFGD